MSRHISFHNYGAIHVMCLFWNKRHVAFTIITFVSRLSDNCLYPFQIREPNSNCPTCLYIFNLQHQTMFHENAVGWHARMEIVHTICLEVAIGPKKFFWKVEFVQKYFGHLNFTLKRHKAFPIMAHYISCAMKQQATWHAWKVFEGLSYIVQDNCFQFFNYFCIKVAWHLFISFSKKEPNSKCLTCHYRGALKH